MTISDVLARDAYIYGYSIDEAYKFLYRTTIEPGTPLNEFQCMRELADDTYTAHPSINNDTLHVQGWLDVAPEPVIVTVPDMDEGRYWVLHTMDLGHYTTAMFGSRTRGARGGRFMFVGDSADRLVPEGMDEVVHSRSHLIKLMGRIMTTGGGDLAIALALMDRWRVQTLSEYVGGRAAAPVRRDFPDPEATNWVQRVNFVLADGTMADADSVWLGQFDAIGLEPGKNEFTDQQIEAAARGERLGRAHLNALAPRMRSAAHLLGTRESVGRSARDLFAEGTLLGQWGLPPVESVYLKTETGSDRLPINGADGKQYRVRFLAPEVSQFWSFTAYACGSRLMVHNELNRHSRGDRTLIPDAEGYYTIDLATVTDANRDNPNLLPIPEEDTYLILRLYGPSQNIMESRYKMPLIEVVHSRSRDLVS